MKMVQLSGVSRSKKAVLLAVLWAASLGFTAHVSAEVQAARDSAQVAQTSPAQLGEQQTMGLLWMRTAAEYRALCYQAYNDALAQVDAAVRARAGKDGRPLAIVLDCDETVLDNTPALAGSAAEGNGQYDGEWWQSHITADSSRAMPGAKDFLDAVKAKGVAIFYVTNRSDKYRYDATVQNMEALGFPSVDREHLLLMKDTGNKQPRYDEITAKYDVVVYLGDNYGDFPIPQGGDMAARREAVDSAKADWGTKYVVLPNPVYGSWVSAIAGDYVKMSPEEREAVNRKYLGNH